MKLNKGICFRCCELRHKGKCEKTWGETWVEYIKRFDETWEIGIVQCDRESTFNHTYIKKQGKEQWLGDFCPYILEHTLKARCK